MSGQRWTPGYKRGYCDALRDVRMTLFAEVGRRLDERDPYSLDTLATDVMEIIDRLEREA